MKKLLNVLIAIICFSFIYMTMNFEYAKAQSETPAPVIDLPESDVYNSGTVNNSLLVNENNNIHKYIIKNEKHLSNMTPSPTEKVDEVYTSKPEKASSKNIIQQEKLSSKEFAPGEIVIHFKNDCPDSEKEKIMLKYNVVKSDDIYKPIYESVKQNMPTNTSKFKNLERKVGKAFVITIDDKDESAVLDTIKKLKKEPYIKYADPNYICEPCATFNDYNNTQLWNLERIQMPETWDYIQESDIKIGILDTGIDYTHPDLCNNVDTELSYNAAFNSNYDVMDYDGHGTHVAGIIGAEANNSIGIVGVNPSAKLVPIKICISNSNSYSRASYMQAAIEHATQYNIPICNLSYGIDLTDSLYNAIREYGQAGGILIIAAGNSSACIDNNETYIKLASLDNVIIVASSNISSGDAESLNTSSNYGNCVDISAPGSSICSTVPSSYSVSRYAVMSGTSMAAPHVAGVASLLKGKYPNMTPLEIKQAIIDGADFVPKIAGEVESSGRLNAFNAINRVPEESYLVVHPRTGESMAAAIRRSLGNRSASKITKLRISGTVEMGDNTTNSSDLTSNILPNLKYVDVSQYPYELKEDMFYDCQNLTTVILPNRKIKIPAYCFMYCSKLNTIYTAHSSSKIINEVDLSNLINGANGDYATQTQCFQGCTSLKTVKLPNTNKIRIAQFTFNNCSNLTTLYINTNTKVTGEADLTEFTDLQTCVLRGTRITSLKLPLNVNISQEAFENCTELKSIQVHPTQTVVFQIDSTAFNNVNAECIVYVNQNIYNNYNMTFARTAIEDIPKQINTLFVTPVSNEKMSTAIKRYLSPYGLSASSVKHLVFQGNVTMGNSNGASESASVFPNLETVDLSLFYGKLGTYAFYNCSKLKTIIRNSSLTSVPGHCFMYCRALKTIIEANSYPQLWNEADLSDLKGELAIDTQAFEYCSNLQTIQFPSGTLGFPSAFPNCINLSTIYKKGNEKTVNTFDLTGISKFWVGWGHNFKNTHAKTIKLPKNIDISESCFRYCTSLNRVEFDNSQTSIINIGSNAFYDVNSECKAYMNSLLANNAWFEIKRSDTEVIPKVAY